VDRLGLRRVRAGAAPSTNGIDPVVGEHLDGLRERFGAAVSNGAFTDQLLMVLSVLFAGPIDADTAARIKFASDPTRPIDAAAVRRILGIVDQSQVPSSVRVGVGLADTERVEISGGGGRSVAMLLDRADASVSVQIRDHGVYEPHLAGFLDERLEPGAVFVDVGANLGYHALRAADAVGPTGRVLAIEAGGDNARLLAASATLNGFDHLEVLPVAAAQRVGFALFGPHIGSNAGFMGPNDAASSVERLLAEEASVVPTLPLDLLGLERVDVIKIDVEGAEAAVIAGAIETLGRCRPWIITEFSAEMTSRIGGIDPSVHLQAIIDAGYRLHLIDRDGGGLVSFDGAAALLEVWGDRLRIEDLAFEPI
jgi:FkbM family methyltransferase